MISVFRKRAIIATKRRPPARRDRVLADLPVWLEKTKSLPDIRLDRVTEIRQAIQEGRYLDDARMADLLADLPEELVHLARPHGHTKVSPSD